MDPRRTAQLERAAKLRANVSVLLGVGDEQPEVIELAAVKRAQLERSKRVMVQVLSWTDAGKHLAINAIGFNGLRAPLKESELAFVVEHTLSYYEDLYVTGRDQAAT